MRIFQRNGGKYRIRTDDRSKFINDYFVLLVRDSSFINIYLDYININLQNSPITPRGISFGISGWVAET